MKNFIKITNSLSNTLKLNEISSSSKNSEDVKELYPTKFKNNSYLYPIFLNKFRNPSELIFRINHPEKPIDKKKLINFHLNPKFKKSSSNKNYYKSTYLLNDSTNATNTVISKNYSNSFLSEEKNAFKNPYSESSIKFFKNNQIRGMVKRSYFFDKIIDSKIKRYALNNFSNLEIEKNNENNDTKDTNLYTKIENIIDKENMYNKIPKLKDYLKYIIKKSKIRERERNFSKESEDETERKLPEIINIKTSRFKFQLSKDDNGEIKDLSKPTQNKIKMTTDRIRDMKLMEKINKIKEKDLVEDLKLILHE